jgi:LPS sulfotransferase NodH
LEARGYVLCGAPRCGSSYLCNLLEATGVLGRPLEYFNGQGLRGFLAADYPDDPEAQLQAMARYAVTPNGVYGLKMFPKFFDHAIDTRWAERLANLSFVYLTRRDLLGQAISEVRAEQTQQWGPGNHRWGPPRTEHGGPVYDFAAINAALISMVRQEGRWQYYFARNGLAPLRLVYEEWVVDPQSAVAAVAALVGLDETPVVEAGPNLFNIQRDDLTEDWRTRFLGQARDLGAFHA